MVNKKNDVRLNGKTHYVEFHDWEEVKGFGTILTKTNELYREKTDYQNAVVFDSSTFGRFFLLDNVIMLSTRDEFMYHEMMTHPALFVHPKPRNVLVIGGGDGGTVREVLRHPSIQKVTLVEIDPKVVELARKFFPQISSKLDDKRCEVIHTDGIKYVKDHKSAFDLIICDSTDPIGPGTVLFTSSFYKSCFEALRKDGIMIAQVGSPFIIGHHVKKTFKKMKQVFPIASLYWTQVPVYADGFYCLAYLSKKYHPQKDFKKARYNKLKLPLKYYNADLQVGAFCLPEYARKLML